MIMSVGRASSSLWRLRKGQGREDVLALAGLGARQAAKLVQELTKLGVEYHRIGAIVELLKLASLGRGERTHCTSPHERSAHVLMPTDDTTLLI